MNVAHFLHTATLLNNGMVLIAGGSSTDQFGNQVPITTAELYNPATGTFTLTGSMANGRFNHTATLLASGKVLVASGTFTTTAELYDPTTGTFSPTGSVNAQREVAAAVRLDNGKVLVAGALAP